MTISLSTSTYDGYVTFTQEEDESHPVTSKIATEEIRDEIQTKTIHYMTEIFKLCFFKSKFFPGDLEEESIEEIKHNESEDLTTLVINMLHTQNEGRRIFFTINLTIDNS